MNATAAGFSRTIKWAGLKPPGKQGRQASDGRTDMQLECYTRRRANNFLAFLAQVPGHISQSVTDFRVPLLVGLLPFFLV